MATFYRLTCEKCSKELSVAQTEAGNQRLCECGNEFTVPRLMQLKQHPVIEEQKSKAASEWHPARGYLFALGILFLAIGAYLHFKIDPLRSELDTEQPAFPGFNDDVRDWPAEVVWDAWVTVRTWDLGYRATPQYLENRAKHTKLTNYLYAGWSLAGLGAVLMITGAALRQKL